MTAGILAVVGVLLLLAAGEPLRALRQPDALFGLNNRCVLVLAGLTHLAVSICVFALRGVTSQAVVLLWLGLNHFIYSAGLAWLHAAGALPGLQALGLILGIRPKPLETCWKGFIVWLVLGSVVVLLCEWRRLKRRQAEAFMKQYREKRRHEQEHTPSSIIQNGRSNAA